MLLLTLGVGCTSNLKNQSIDNKSIGGQFGSFMSKSSPIIAPVAISTTSYNYNGFTPICSKTSNATHSIKSKFISNFADSKSTKTQNQPGNQSTFNTLYGLVADSSDNLYICDAENNSIRKITPDGFVSTFAGTGVSGSNDGAGNQATFSHPQGIAIDTNNNLYITDSYNNSIRKITPNGFVSTFAGTGISGSNDGIGNQSTFSYPQGIAIDTNNNLYIADSYNNRIRKVKPDGIVSTISGTGVSGSNDGTGNQATFSYPQGIAVDTIGNLYIAEKYSNKIRKIIPDGTVSTFAGTGVSGSNDGIVNQVTFSSSEGIAIDSSGNLYVIDNKRIRKITPDGIVLTIECARK